MVRLRLLQRLEPSSVTPYRASNIPEFLFVVVKREHWMRSATSYESEAAAGKVLLWDAYRIDAYVSREHFRDEYAQGVERLSTRTACALRALSSWFGVKDDVVDASSLSGGGSTQRAQVNSANDEMIEKLQFLLVAVHTATLVDALLWDEKNYNMPTLMRAIKKDTDVCTEYPLRYDTKRLRLALPTEQQLRDDHEHLAVEMSTRN